MPRRALTLAALAALAGCAGVSADLPQASRDPTECLRLFDRYDTVVWAYPSRPNGYDNDNVAPIMPSAWDRPTRLLRDYGCVTQPGDLDGLPALAQRLAPYRIVDSGPAIPATALNLGIVTGIYDEGRATQFFRGLGYRSRGIGAPALGRRLYIGPFTTQGALDQALQVAREAGFIAPHPALHTKF